MTDLRNTIAHIYEHKRHLTGANEATTQQYVILPILRALGWDDANLASMEVLPEYKVGNGNVDYALKVGQKPQLFVECKKWNEPLEKHENQIANYAFNAGAPIGVLTNGKIWCFYFSWVEGKPVNERIFCEIDIGNRENAVSNLETYLLRSNVTSDRAKRNAQKALKEKGKTNTSEISPTVPNPNLVKAREKKPSIFERYVKSTTEADRNNVAVKVVELRINATGSKPLSWRKIREKLGLKNDEFHEVVRHSPGYRTAVIDRIKSLREQDGGWEYSGKLEVLTGIEITEAELK